MRVPVGRLAILIAWPRELNSNFPSRGPMIRPAELAGPRLPNPGVPQDFYGGPGEYQLGSFRGSARPVSIPRAGFNLAADPDPEPAPGTSAHGNN